MKKPRIFLLDEATSALDGEREHLVQDAIDAMITGQRGLETDPSRPTMTVVIVVHRLSTVKNADCIVVIQGGKIAEKGRHEELLLKNDGLYRALIRKQLGQVDHSKDRLSQSPVLK